MGKKKFVWVASMLVAAAGWAGNVGGGIGLAVFTPPDGQGGLSPLYKGSLYYFPHPKMEFVAEVGYASYQGDGISYRYIPANLRGVYHFRFKPDFDPYVGAGPMCGWKSRDGDDALTWGYSLLTGVNHLLTENTTFGAGVEYAVPDATDFNAAYPAFSITLGWAGI